ncbi:MAG TPA: hypothetical protein VI583_05760 [Cyclobacteriaceae bacterium]|nr:hypothetical protein [Cyclobacteriaceae bacterium]
MNYGFAQIPEQIKERADRFWSFSLSIGGTASGGPAKDLEKAMIAAGFDDGAPCVLFCTKKYISYPFSETGLGVIGLPWSLRLSRKLGPYFKTVLIMSNNPMGRTVGHKSSGLLGSFLDTKYSTFTFAPAIALNLEDAFQLGVGPAIYATKSWSEKSTFGSNPKLGSKIGFIILTDITIPARSRFFFNMNFEYRHVGEAEIEKYETTPGSNGIGVPVTTADFSHGFLSVGIGVRL